MDPMSCRSFSRKEPLNIGHFCGKWPIKIRDPMSLCHPVHFSSRLSACVRVCVCVRERGKEGGREQRHVCWRKKVFFGGTNCLHTRCLSYRMANSILGISSSEEYVLQKNILQNKLPAHTVPAWPFSVRLCVCVCMCVYVRVCVCARARERGGDGERVRERERHT